MDRSNTAGLDPMVIVIGNRAGGNVCCYDAAVAVVGCLTLTDPLRMQPRGHKINGTKPSEDGNNTVGEKKTRIAGRGKRTRSSQQRTYGPPRNGQIRGKK